MAEPYRSIESKQLVSGSGIIEIICLTSGGSAPSILSIFDSAAGEGITGRRLWDLAAVTADSRITPILNIPFSKGIFTSISGANAQTVLTVR